MVKNCNQGQNYLEKCILIDVNCNKTSSRKLTLMAGKTLFGCQMIVSVSSTNNEYSNSILNILFTSSE